MNNQFFALFYIEQTYYLPHLLPVHREMTRRGLETFFVFRKEKRRDFFNQAEDIKKVAQAEDLNYRFGFEGLPQAGARYLICANLLPAIELNYEQSVLIYHGSGTKSGHVGEQLNAFDIRFMEGEFGKQELHLLYPQLQQDLRVVGFSKLDLIFDFSRGEGQQLFQKYGLDKSKKTILYAPTFYPSSFELMPDTFPDEFRDCNIIVKPHYYSYLRKRYKRQRKKLKKWSAYGNVYIAALKEYDLVPFFYVADLLVSDESSAIYEFAALNKPVIINRFLFLRLNYRFSPGKLKRKFTETMNAYRDIGPNIYDYSELKKTVVSELKGNPHYEKKRRSYSTKLIGNVDGNVSKRIVDTLME